jgi:protein-tyrosine phosphatase
VIDLHCHVIPGIDDGPATIEDSLALCDAARAAGTETIIATPHLNWDYPAVDAVVIHTALARLNSVLREASVDMRLRPGAEMGLSRLPDLSDAEIGVLRLGGGPYVLVECPHQAAAELGIMDAIRVFAKRGHRILLGHPERSPTFRKHPRMLADLTADGMLSCVTARALTGDYGVPVRAYAWEILEAGLVHALASDAHDVSRRPPDLRPSLERAGLEPGQIDYFIGEAPTAIIAGDPVPAPPQISGPVPRRRSPRRRLTSRRTTTER